MKELAVFLSLCIIYSNAHSSFPGSCTVFASPHSVTVPAGTGTITGVPTKGYVPGTTYNIQITSTTAYRGLLLIAQNTPPNSTPLGVWNPTDTNTQINFLGTCPTNALGHNGNMPNANGGNGVTSSVGQWTAPGVGSGTLTLVALLAGAATNDVSSISSGTLAELPVPTGTTTHSTTVFVNPTSPPTSPPTTGSAMSLSGSVTSGIIIAILAAFVF